MAAVGWSGSNVDVYYCIESAHGLTKTDKGVYTDKVIKGETP